MDVNSQKHLQRSLSGVEVNHRFTEAVMRFTDGRHLAYSHRVDERWVKAIRHDHYELNTSIAEQLLTDISQFRLNAKHLDIQFQDGSRWDETLSVRHKDTT